jgi:hypothetical protein
MTAADRCWSVRIVNDLDRLTEVMSRAGEASVVVLDAT